MNSSPIRRILHCDLDCFYAAVHVRDDPSLAGRPVVVGGEPSSRGVVAAANYEARHFGIHSAMPSSQAKRLCADVVFLRPDFPRYKRESEAIFAIYRQITPLVQPVSIDEAYLDVTQHLGEFASATEVAKAIRGRVRAERGLTVSVGVGPNRLIAKIASDQDKPDGLTVVPPRRVAAFLAPLPVRRLRGVGPATEKRLAALGIRTVTDLRNFPAERLVQQFGRHGQLLSEFSHGVDDRPLDLSRVRRSLSSEHTYSADLTSVDEMREQVRLLAGEVGAGLRKRDLSASTVTLKARFSDFTTVTRSRTVGWPVQSDEVIGEIALELLSRTEAGIRAVRLLGVGSSGFVRSQQTLFDAR